MKRLILPHQQHQGERLRFLVERMILFTDAVFAIAITLLILEIKVPNLDYEGLTNTKIKAAVWDQQFALIGFIISFFVIAQYWVSHHRNFAYVDNYNGKLIFLNLLFLMFIVLMPFTSALYSKYINFLFPAQLYYMNIALTGFINLWMWYYISNPKNKICNTQIDSTRKKYHTLRMWIEPLVFLASTIFAYAIWSRLFFFGIFIFQFIVSKYFEKKYGLQERFK